MLRDQQWGEGIPRAEAFFHTLALKLIAGGFPPAVTTSFYSSRS